MIGRVVVVASMMGMVGCQFPPLPLLDEDAQPADAAGDAIDAEQAADASPDARACTETMCSGGVLEVCGAGGTVESVVTCSLGCFSAERCNRVDPSNGLGAQVDSAAGLADVSIPAGATIDTDSGLVRSGGQVIAVATETVAQVGGPSLRVLMAQSFTIDDIRVTGTLPVAFVAYGNVTLAGLIDASADASVAGPGALLCVGNGRGGNQAPGASNLRRAGHSGTGQYVWSNPGGGGGGFGSAGAKGGDYQSPTFIGGAGGSANGVAELVPLRGGCPGGGVNSGGVDVGHGGLGGGAIQIVSATAEIRVLAPSPSLAGVHVGGGGGRGCDNNGYGSGAPAGAGCGIGGGGSGGAVLLEAPTVRFEADAVLLAAGGGGGGSGGCGEPRHGQEAPPNGATASGGACPGEAWGTPAPGGAGASVSAAQVGGDVDYFAAGGGGGGLGRLRINTSDGTYVGAPNLVARGVLTTGTVTTR